MTEQKLRDRIELDLLYWREVDRNQEHSDIKARAGHIVVLVKEAGWIDSKVMVDADLFHQWAISKGYVKLADDPHLNEEYLISKLSGLVNETRIPAECPDEMRPFIILKYSRDILKASWRKVQLEEK